VRVWDAQTGQEKLTLKGHTGGVLSVAFSRDGTRIASASGDNTVKVWGSSTGQEKLTLKGHTDLVSSVAFSPDGKRIASASGDRTVKVWDARTGQEKFSLKGHTGHVWSVAYSPDGKRIASGSWDRTVKVWDAHTEQKKFSLKGHTGQVWSVAFSPDGKRIASADRNGKRFDFDAATGKPLPPDRMPLPEGQQRALQPGGHLVAIASGKDILVYGPPDATEAVRFLHRQATRRWHAEQADECEKAKQWPAAAFHLERLHRTSLTPTIRSRLLVALKKADDVPPQPSNPRPQFAIVPLAAVDNPMLKTIKRNLAITDAARAASAVCQTGLFRANLLALPAPQAGPR
jgi:hypothetical protein